MVTDRLEIDATEFLRSTGWELKAS